MARRKIIPYNPKLKELARQLRNDSTKAEVILWQQLKGKQVMGFDFHRQKPLGNFIVHFYCYELELVIELDGWSHQFEETLDRDQQKQTFLESYNLSVLRFHDSDVLHDMANVLRTIENYVLSYQEGN